MKNKRWIVKLVREALGYIVLGAICLVAIIMYSKVGALPDAILGALITGCVGGIVGIALNSKEPKNPTEPFKEK